jgi:tetratricopeptide (TPR) repeat protein
MPDDRESAFDAILDRILRGEPVDSAEVLASGLDLSESERRQIENLCRDPKGRRPRRDVGAVSLEDGGPPVDAIGGCRLGARLGVGGTGAVFLGRDEALGRDVAVKILGPDLIGSGERAARFLREVRAIAKLNHPNIVTVHAAGEEKGLRYMTMELVSGATLAERLAAGRGRPAVRDAIAWGLDVARALAAAHDAGVLHRDVKPSNIKIADDGRAVLLDFGLAAEAGAPTITETGGFRGSPQYASPEQVGLSGIPIDERTDVYSLGATLYEAATGVAPFIAETRDQLFHKILTRDPVRPRALVPDIPRDFETVVMTALAKDPAHRYGSARDLVRDLEAVRDGRPVAARPPSMLGRLARWARRQPAKAALAAGIAIGVPLVAALAWYIVANKRVIELGSERMREEALGALLESAFLEYGEGDAVHAERLFAEALEAAPDLPEARAGLALARLQRGDVDGALRGVDGLPPALSGSHWVEAVRLEARTRLGARSRPASDSRPLPAPASPVDHFVAGVISLNRFHHGGGRSHAATARGHFRHAVLASRAPNPLYHSELGHAAWHDEAHDEARQVAAAIEQLFPETPERWFVVGRTLIAADRERALDALEKAANPPPRSLVAQTMIVRRLAESQRRHALPLVRELGRALVESDPARGSSHHALGVAHLMSGDLDAAISSMREAIARSPGMGVAHSRLAEALVGKDAFLEAAEAGRAAVRLLPEDAAAWNVLGVALLSQSSHSEAIDAFRAALRLRPNLPPALCNLGRALLAVGDFDAALEALRAGHAGGSKDPNWKHPSAAWIKQAERRQAQAARLQALRDGAGAESTPEEQIALARDVCLPQRRFFEAARMYRVAFDEAPEIATSAHLVAAAEAAVAAAEGAGRDPPAEAAERGDLRARAAAWIRAARERGPHPAHEPRLAELEKRVEALRGS